MLRQLLAISLFIFSSALPALDLELTQGINSALPIGVNSFGNNLTAQQMAQVINNDLRLSGQFKLVSAYNDSASANPSLNAWRQAGADTVLMGQVKPLGNNRFDVRIDLLDAAAQGSTLLTQTFQISGEQARSLAHHISDMVYEKLTGERGVFSTRIAYILVQRNQGRSRYSLEVADADGYNPRSLVVSSESIMSPSWSPDGKKIAYVSFEKKKAQIFIVNAVDGHRQLVTNFNGINGAPAWSPDGRLLAVVLSKGGSPKIYTVELSSGRLQQLTFGDAIDTEPRFSPDGHSVIFTSGRGGSPQIYRIALADGTISRLTYSGNYNARASYTPDQKRIVLMHRDEAKHFNIAVQDLTNGQLGPITNASADESPSVAPNGRLVVYATQHRGQGILGIVSTDGRIQLRLPTREGDVQEPAWSPYLG